jgi:hypothetical protein
VNCDETRAVLNPVDASASPLANNNAPIIDRTADFRYTKNTPVV